MATQTETHSGHFFSVHRAEEVGRRVSGRSKQLREASVNAEKEKVG